MKELKFFVKGILLSLMLLCATNLMAETYTDSYGTWTYYTLYNDETACRITGYEGSVTDLKIPSTITNGENTYSVTEVSLYMYFKENSTVVTLTIPSSVTEISNLYHFKNLVSISVEGDNNLYYATLDGVLYNKDFTTLVAVPTTLKSFEIPNSVTDIGNEAFYNCSLLESVVIPASITSIESYAFFGCSSLKAINIPTGVASVDGGTFNNCTSLASIDIPESVTSIGEMPSVIAHRLHLLTFLKVWRVLGVVHLRSAFL